MNEEFVKSIYKTVVEEAEAGYKHLYENTEITDDIIDYWKDALELYHSLNLRQKDILMQIIKQTMIDTISEVFGVLDGSSTLSGGDFECELKIDGVSTEDELQDTFLEYVEENE